MAPSSLYSALHLTRAHIVHYIGNMMPFLQTLSQAHLRLNQNGEGGVRSHVFGLLTGIKLFFTSLTSQITHNTGICSALLSLPACLCSMHSITHILKHTSTFWITLHSTHTFYVTFWLTHTVSHTHPSKHSQLIHTFLLGMLPWAYL
jgi:hypothetical protein